MSRLETLIRTASDEGVFRINPIRFAAERGIAEAEAIELFLQATLAGLVEMDWLLYCPLCSDVVANFRSLRAVHNHFHCHLCHADYEATLDDYIAVTFTVTRGSAAASAITIRSLCLSRTIFSLTEGRSTD